MAGPAKILAFDGGRTVEQAELRPAAVGDLVAWCSSTSSDKWTLAPVAIVDDVGQVIAIRDRAGRVRSLWALSAADAFVVLDADHYDLARLSADRWRSFRGVAAIQDLGRIARRRP